MTDLSSVSGVQKLTSKPKVSLEAAQKEPTVETSSEIKQMEAFEANLQQLNQAFILAREIQHSLETALKNLSPTN